MKGKKKYWIRSCVGMLVIYFAGVASGHVVHMDVPIWVHVVEGILGGVVAAFGLLFIEKNVTAREEAFWQIVIDDMHEHRRRLWRMLDKAHKELAEMKERDRRIFERSEDSWADRQLEKEGGDAEIHG